MPNDPASSASAPPPMVPSAKQRVDAVYETWTNMDVGVSHDIETLHVRAMEQAYRDGWNAALAAQPPEPAPEMRPSARHFYYQVASFEWQVKDPRGDATAPKTLAAFFRDLDAYLVALAAQSALAESQVEESRLSDLLDKTIGKAEQLETTLADLQAQHHDLGQAYIVLQEHRDELQSALAESQKDTADFKRQRDRLGEECDRYIQWNTDLQRALAESRADNQALVQHVAEWDRRHRAVADERDLYKQASKDCHDALGKCAIERDESLVALGIAQSERFANIEKMIDIEKERDESLAEVARLTGIIEDGRSEERVKGLTQRLYHISTPREEDAAAVIEASDVLLAQSRELSRLRSPTATGEDDLEFAREIVEAFPSYAFVRSSTEILAKEVAVGVAAARARGVREGIERCIEWIKGNTVWLIFDNDGEWAVCELRALAAPEPQEEKL